MTISTATAAGISAPSQTSSIGIQDFLKILSAQLNNQDPLKPVDNEQFIAQIAQFASLQQTRDGNTKLDSLLAIQSATQSIGIIGKSVSVDNNGVLFNGTVSGLSLATGEPLMTVTASDNSTFLDQVRMSQIQTIF